MKNIIGGLVILVCALFFLGACGSATPEAHSGHEAQACSCAKGKAGESVWCDACGHGYVEGKKVACKGCYDAKSGGEACTDCVKPETEEAPAETEEAPAETEDAPANVE